MLEDYRKYLIIGPKCSGKSVLLASLVDWLIKRPERIQPAGQTLWKQRWAGPCPGLRPFPLERILDGAREDAAWPVKTNELSGLRFKAQRDRMWGLPPQTVVRDFVDVPGERFADFLGSEAEGRHQSFEGWSNSVLEKFPRSTDPDSVAAVKQYEELLRRKPVVSGDELVDFHRNKVLAPAARRYRYLLTPSTAVPDPDDPESRSAVPSDRFAPLPLRYEKGHEETRRKFAAAFAEYQQEVIHPLRRMIYEADGIVLTVDPSWILGAGASLLPDQLTLLRAFATYLRSMETWMKHLLRFFWHPLAPGSGPGRLRSIVLCGTKADVFLPADASRLEDLLESFYRDVANAAQVDRIAVSRVVVSAMRATHLNENKPESLFGYRDGQEREVRPSRVPAQWPEDWPEGAYRFAVGFEPRIPRNGLYPPRQRNLDLLFRRLEGGGR